MKTLIFSGLLAIACCTACTASTRNALPVPTNEATKLEEDRIDLTLQEIEQISADLGRPRKFRSLPIVVTSEDPIATNRLGFCSSLGFGDNGFISINRAVLKDDTERNRLDYLFGVLLHEIGHCYFNRIHEDTVVQKPGFRFEVEVTDSVGGTTLYLDAFPVSIMNVAGDSASEMIRVPSAFKRYYVAEIMGIERLESVGEVEKFPGVRLIPKSE